LRAAVLAAALARRPAGYPDPEALPPTAVPYAAEVTRMDALLREVTPAHWRTRVPATGTSVRELVEHLSGNDAALAAALGMPALGVPVPVPVTVPVPVRGGGRVPDGTREEPPHALWRARAQALLRHALTGSMQQPVDFDGLPLEAGNVYLVRAFETWNHADDIRGALGRPPQPPQPQHLAPLANLHVNLLPTALALSNRAHPGRTLEIRLTGPGGGSWRIPGTPGSPVGEPDMTLTANILDYCYSAANRRDPATVPQTVEGDHALAEDLLAVLTAFSHD